MQKTDTFYALTQYVKKINLLKLGNPKTLFNINQENSMCFKKKIFYFDFSILSCDINIF
jgi:hypothetical protein